MGRTILASMIVIGCAWPSVSAAQTSPGATPGTQATPGAPRGGLFGVTIRHDPPPPPPPQSRPTSPAGVPLVPPAPPSALDSVDIFRANPRTYAPRFDRSSRRNRLYGYGAGFYIPDPFGYISQPDSSSPRLDRYMSETGTGYARNHDGRYEYSYQGEPLASIAQRTEGKPQATPKTFYVIPRCYAGDVRPRPEQLPAGCQIARLREIPPVIAPTR